MMYKLSYLGYKRSMINTLLFLYQNQDKDNELIFHFSEVNHKESF